MDHKTVCIIDTNLNLDFGQPLDYIDSPKFKKEKSVKINDDKPKEFKAFSGGAQRLDGKPVKKSEMKEEEEEWNPRLHKLPRGVRASMNFDSFTGKGIKLG